MAEAQLAEPTDLQQGVRARGGLLAMSKPLPNGKVTDLLVRTSGCVEPLVGDYCDVPDPLPEPNRPETFVFRSFPIERGSECSTIGGVPNEEIARAGLDGTTEWAIGRRLSTVSEPDGASLADADPIGTVADADFVAAVSCLEQAAADTGFGVEWVLHAPVAAAAYLVKDNLLVDGKSPTGATWIISPGYARQGSTTIRLWATGTVWAGADPARVIGVADRRQNTAAAFAARNGVVAFDPCLLLAIDVTVPACPA